MRFNLDLDQATVEKYARVGGYKPGRGETPDQFFERHLKRYIAARAAMVDQRVARKLAEQRPAPAPAPASEPKRPGLLSRLFGRS